jgi:hypothetical protein
VAFGHGHPLVNYYHSKQEVRQKIKEIKGKRRYHKFFNFTHFLPLLFFLDTKSFSFILPKTLHTRMMGIHFLIPFFYKANKVHIPFTKVDSLS